MTDSTLLGPWVRRFLLEHLVSDRNLSRNTQRSYRDALVLLIPFVASKLGKQVDRLSVLDMTAEIVRLFLRELEENRGCGITTRNQRLAAIHALARFVGLKSPEHIDWCGQIRSIPFKKGLQRPVTYLEKPEIDALLAAPDRNTAQGNRDHALLLFLYNSGARADEAAQLLIGDLDLAKAPQRDHSFVTIRGKGNKLRRCPLWPGTGRALSALTNGRAPTEHLFLNRRSQPITRFGIHTLVERHVQKASKQISSLTIKRVSPHTIRHTTATHLLRAGVDINTIRAWLGHVLLSTTNIYAEVDLEMKAKALAHCEVTEVKPAKRWREDLGLLRFLRTL
ncbi:MAG: tyrosine-type recombinase/integrase [Candidatus Binatia bacterium]